MELSIGGRYVTLPLHQFEAGHHLAVSQVARYSHEPKQSHAAAVKMIVRYLARTREKGTIVKPTGLLKSRLLCRRRFAGLFGSEDSEDPTSARLRTGYIILMGGSSLIWHSKLQTKTALSTMEAEYSALSSSLRALLPLKRMLHELTTGIDLPTSTIATIKARAFEDKQRSHDARNDTSINLPNQVLLDKSASLLGTRTKRRNRDFTMRHHRSIGRLFHKGTCPRCL